MSKTKTTTAVATIQEVDDPIAKSQADLEQLAAFQLRTWQARQAKASALSRAEQLAGDALVDAALKGGVGEPDHDASAIARGRAELAVLHEALDSARRRQPDAIRAFRAAEAAGKRSSAAALRTEADERELHTKQLLADLREQEGIDYEPARLIPFGGIATHGELPRAVSRTQALRLQADALDRSASDLERQAVAQAGQVEGGSVDELVAGVLSNPMVLGPRLVDIATWAGEAEKKERERRRRLAHAGEDALEVRADVGYADPRGPIAFRLTWRGGAIVAGESGTFVPDASIAESALERALTAPRSVPVGDPPAVTRRPSSELSPYYTGPRPVEIVREAANTGKSIEQVAAELGASHAVAAAAARLAKEPIGATVSSDASPMQSDLEREAAATGEQPADVAKRLGAAAP